MREGKRVAGEQLGGGLPAGGVLDTRLLSKKQSSIANLGKLPMGGREACPSTLQI